MRVQVPVPAKRDNSSAPPVAFYCVSDGGYFLGAVGLINSLRLVGHTEPIYLLDCGLTAAHRELLEPHVTMVDPPRQAPPWLLKTHAPLRHPAEVMVLIDADMIVTRPLTDLIAQASHGCVVAFQNNMDRFVPEWGELLDLGPIRREPYLCAGLVAMDRSPGEEVLRLTKDRSTAVDFDKTFWRDNVPGYPFLYGDQDVFNPVLASRVEQDQIVALDHRLSPAIPFEGLAVTDAATLRCAYEDGVEPYVLHYLWPPKPWQEPAYDGVYSRLLRRLLCGPDIAVRVPRRDIPLRLRTGPLAYAEQRRIDLRQQIRWRLGGLLRRRAPGHPSERRGTAGGT
jgi:hypothetical protein